MGNKEDVQAPSPKNPAGEEIDSFAPETIRAAIKDLDRNMEWDLPTDVIEHLICCIEIRQVPELNDQVSLVELSDNISALEKPMFVKDVNNYEEKLCEARQESKRSGNSIPVKDAPTAQGPMEIFALTERFEDHVTMLRIDQDNPCIDNPSARLNIYSAYFSTEFPKRLHVEGTGRIGPGPWETFATSGWAKCPLNPNLSAAEAIAAIECWEQAYHIEPPGPRDGEFTLCMDKDKRPVARVDDISMEIFDARVFHQNPDTLSIRGLALSNALAFGPIRACKAIGWAEDKIKPGMSAAEAISTIKRWSKTIFIPQLYQLK
jgi:hypothetical protein